MIDIKSEVQLLVLVTKVSLSVPDQSISLCRLTIVPCASSVNRRCAEIPKNYWHIIPDKNSLVSDTNFHTCTQYYCVSEGKVHS